MGLPSQGTALLGVRDCLVVRELDKLLNLHLAMGEVQNCVGSTVGWEPVAAIDLFSVQLRYCLITSFDKNRESAKRALFRGFGLFGLL